MWNLIFELFVLVFVSVSCFKFAKAYGDRFKAALSRLQVSREGEYGFTGDLLEFRMYRAAAIFFELATYVSFWKFLATLSLLLK